MGRSEFFSKYLRIADGLLDVGKKRVLAVTDLVVEAAKLYGALANDGLQMQAGLNEAGPIGALPAKI